MKGGVVTPGVATILLFSRIQKMTLSAAEAECMAVVEAVKEAFFVKQVLQLMRPGGVEFCVSMLDDNQGGCNQVYNFTTNHWTNSASATASCADTSNRNVSTRRTSEQTITATCRRHDQCGGRHPVQETCQEGHDYFLGLSK